LPEPRVGMIAGANGVHRLPRQIPYHLAMGMILASRRVSAPMVCTACRARFPIIWRWA
jgi:enoyl-CoA hydratase/carnithine racemase